MTRFLTAVTVLGAYAVLFTARQGTGVIGLLVLLAYAALVWTAYLAGLHSRGTSVVVAVAAVLPTGARIAFVPHEAPQHIAALVMFVVLPVLVGRYLAQHRRLVGTLDAHNRQLRTEQVLLAEREQLRERLRIARDVHDSLGRRLSIVSVRAAALEVADLPPEEHAAVCALADSARDAVAELYQVVGSLRGAGDDTPGVDRITGLVEEFRAAGVDVAVTEIGTVQDLPAAADRAAYRVIEEGLTNAAKHAQGASVTIRLTYETDSLVATVTNPVESDTALGGGFGLAGLTERVGEAGGFLDHRGTDGEFRLVAMLPTKSPDLSPPPTVGKARTALLGVATAAVLFVLLPASMLTGVS